MTVQPPERLAMPSRAAPQAKPRIGYLVPQFPGQTHAFFWREVKALEARGVAVRLLSTRPPPPGLVAHAWSEEAAARTLYLASRSPLDAAAALPALPWRDLGRVERGLGRDFLVSLGAARRLLRAAAGEGLGHVHVHSCGRSALIALLAERMGGPSYSLTLHGPLWDYGPGQNLKWRGARFATVITRKLLAEVKTVLREDRPARIAVQPMGIEADALLRPAPYLPPRPGEPIRLFCCGRLNPVKGHEDLLEALRLLLDGGTAVTLAIAGEDDDGGTGYRRVLEARIAELRLGPHARLLGAVDEARVREELWRAHAFVLASFHEPLGVALMEAMAAGVPTVGTAAGGVRELITHGVDGLLVPPREPARIAQAILQVAREPRLAHQLSRGGELRARQLDAARGAETLMREMGLGGPAEAVPAPP